MYEIVLIFLSLLLLVVPKVFADNSGLPSLSDAIYADLAVKHGLDNVSLYYKDSKTGDTAMLNEERHWLPASTVKVFAAMYAYKLIKEKKLSLSQEFQIESKNSVPTELVTDNLPQLVEGESVTADRLIKQMLIQSDNTAFNVLLDVLGRDDITRYIQTLGLLHSRVGSKLNLDTSQEQYEFDVEGYGINTTTAQDYALAFLLIKNNKIPGSKELFDILKNQKINNMIPAFLPKEVVCAHKTGDLAPLYHDGGICLDKKQVYILSIFTNAGDPNLLAHLSEIIYTKNFDLVGQKIEKKPLGRNLRPIDPLVMTHPNSNVLAASTLNFPVPSITASDLGITAADLSLEIKDEDLPRVIIPADSPFHTLSDGLQVLKRATSLDPKARRGADLDTAKLRLSEAKDLFRRGKKDEAKIILRNIQAGLNTLAKDPSLAQDSQGQNGMESVSETRFTILSDELSNSKGEEKLKIIKEIAKQAKTTVQDVSPKTPDAINAINPSQKPLVGEVIEQNAKETIVKTAGGQQISIPSNNSIVVKSKDVSPLPQTPRASPQSIPQSSKSLSSVAVGTSVALIGSTTNNTFAPTFILTNIPKEIAAPVPVIVAKVDAVNKTMIVIENGVYTQVNINKDTTIKGADTDIPLAQIKAGDVVVVHGKPLVQSNPTLTPSPILSPAKVIASPSPIQNLNNSNVSAPSATPSPKVPPTGTSLPSSYPGKETTNKPPQQPSQPKVIESTSIKLIEKKDDVIKKGIPSTPPPSKTGHKSNAPKPSEAPKSPIKP